MNNRERFYDWMISEKKFKESKAKEFISVLDLVDEKCVCTKGDGQYSLYKCDSLKAFEYIRINFLLSKQVGAIIGGKKMKQFIKNKDLIFEYYQNAPFDNTEDAEVEEMPATVNVVESADVDNEVTAESIADEATAEADCILDVNEPLSRRYDRIFTKRIDSVYAEVSKGVALRRMTETNAEDDEISAYFDLINGTMGIDRQSSIEKEAMAEIYKENYHIYGKNGNAFLYGKDRLFISEHMFGQNNEGNVIESAIFHSLREHKLKYRGIYAMLPDVLDDFAKETRAQLVYKGERIFPIPRSIAYALGYQDELRKSGKDYSEKSKLVFADYDGDEFVAIGIDVSKDENVEYSVFTRKGIEKVNKNHKSYNDLFDECVKQYVRIYGITFEEDTLRDLKASRAFTRLFNTHKPILLKQSSGYLRLDYDQSIHKRISDIIDDDVKSLRDGKTEVIIGSGLYQNSGVEYLGCRVVQERVAKRMPLWREYLPHLSLEVIKDGRYDQIELIKKNEYRDVLKTLGEEEIIRVENGTMTFGTGKKFYSLPLERDIENDAYKEKQSIFKHESFPLATDVRVSLEIHYKYGDANSYKLIAKPLDKNAPFDMVESEWTDRAPLPLGKVSKFVSTGGMLPKLDDVLWIKDGFEKLPQMLQKFDRFPKKDKIDASGQCPSIFKCVYNNYAAKRRCLNLEAYKNNNDVKELLEYIADSQALHELFNIAFERSRYTQNFIEVSDRSNAGKVRDYARECLADLGVFYQKCYADDIVDSFVKLGKIRYLALISRCLSKDYYGVYEAISKKIYSDGLDPRRVRSLAANCNYISDWAKNLYETTYGPEALNIIRDKVIELILNHDLSVKTNPRIVRDYMELLLCICNINEVDKKFIDPNDPNIKKLVKKIKHIDDVIYNCGNSFEVKDKNISFVCRLQTERMDKMGLDRMHDLTFMLVQILTGAQDINLTGFEDID